MTGNNLIKGYFAGIGSRATPPEYLEILTQASKYIVYSHLLKLRSGHAIGADRACEIGAEGTADIYLPWKNYGIKPYKNDLGIDDPGMKVIGKTIIPSFKNIDQTIKIAEFMCDLVARTPFDEMNRGVQLLMLRNVNQIIGHSFTDITISKLVLCYSNELGGTSYATMLAKYLKVPIVNVLNKNLQTVLSEIDETLLNNSFSSSESIQLLKGIYE